MEQLLYFIFGSVEDPVMMAACFMLFLAIIDSLFSLVNTLLNANGVKS